MKIEFDPAKSESNRQKHGIDFIEAQRLWEDLDAIVVPAPHTEESRWALIAQLRGKLWIAIFTIRGAKTRIISVRRTRTLEERKYHESKEDFSSGV